jgi:poly-gamma-glutamate capsule biosynthesis protein CapA/YwtB (metallophosphatase superfamily)
MDNLKILLVGDVMLGRGVNRLLRTFPSAYPWGDTLPIFQKADFRICNLESAMSNRGKPWPAKMFHFRTDTKNIAVLGAAGINCVSLGNNHTLDFGYDALADTLKTLSMARIGHAGAGMNAIEAFAPAIATTHGLRIAMLSFTDNEPEWEAGENRPGVAYVPIDFEEDRATHLFDAIRAARSRSDLLIVAAHWGPNWGYKPPPRHVPFAHRMIDLGADIVFGHSGHVFRGVEIYRDRPILYCTGNFLDDYAVDEEEPNDESFIFVVDIKEGRPTLLTLRPTIICDCQAQRAAGGRAREIVAKMKKLCAEMQTRTRERDDHLEIPIGDA